MIIFMTVFKILAAIGMLAIAGAVGCALGYLQHKWEDRKDGDIHKR